MNLWLVVGFHLDSFSSVKEEGKGKQKALIYGALHIIDSWCCGLRRQGEIM